MLLRGHNDAVLCLQFVGDTLVSGSSDQTIKVNIYQGLMEIIGGLLFRYGVSHKVSAR